MEIDLYQIIHNNFILMIFVVIGLGYLFGRIKIFSIEMGPTIGVLLAGLLFGHLGFEVSANVASFGFTIFIFAVGFQAGPSFFTVFAEDGLKYLLLSFIIATFAVGLALLLSQFFKFETGINAGLLAGALTSTPTLAGAQDAIKSGLANLPAGITAVEAAENISVGYAITYILGTVGLIIFIKYFPKLFNIDLPAEANKLDHSRTKGKGSSIKDLAKRLPIIRAYRVQDKSFTQQPLGVVRMEKGEKGYPFKIRRGDKLLDPDPDKKLHINDVVSIIGLLSDFKDFAPGFAEEVLDAELLNYHIVREEIIITNAHAVGKTVKSFNFGGIYGCFLTGIERASINLPAEENMVVNKGDRLMFAGEEEQLKKLSKELGYIEKDVEETDLLTFSFGIGAGVLLGLIMIKVGNFSISLGSAGGLLLSGIFIGYLRTLHPTFGGLPNAALLLFKDFGLVLFMAGVGVQAGGGIAEAFLSIGPNIIICSLLVTMLPVVVGYTFGLKVLKMNPAILLGSITGAMTSTPALNIVNSAAKSNIPALGYAGTYTFANVLLTFAGSFMMML